MYVLFFFSSRRRQTSCALVTGVMTCDLSISCEETDGYDEMVVLRDIRLESHCEHHMVPIIGKAHVAYLPGKRVVGISKLARVVEVYAKRLQIQEKLTAQVANTIQTVLQPRGVAVVIEAAHQCMTTRGVHRSEVRPVGKEGGSTGKTRGGAVQ